MTTASSSAFASRSSSPWTTSSASPSKCRSPADSRTARTSPTDSASRRRATKASTCAEAPSSHCASSTTQTSGRSSATSDSRLRTASPTRKRSGASPSRRPNAVPSASRCGPGSRSSRSSERRAELMQARERELHLRLHARRPRDPAARRALHQVLQQRGLADARLAAQHQHPALTRAHARQQLIQRLALAGPAEQPRHAIKCRHGHARAYGRPGGRATDRDRLRFARARQPLVHEAHDHRALADRGGAALERAGAHVPGGVDAGHAGLEQRRPRRRRRR